MAPHFILPVNEQFPQPPDEVFHAWKEFRDPDAGRTLIKQYRGFVVSLVLRYAGVVSRGVMDLEDLTQVGHRSVLQHLDTFEPERGNRFLPYSWKGIKGTMDTVRLQHGSAIKYPAHFVPMLRRYQMRKASGLELPQDTEIAELLEIPETGPAIAPHINAPWSVAGFRMSVALGEAASLEAIAESQPDALDTAYHAGLRRPAEEDFEELEERLAVWQLLVKTFTAGPETKGEDSSFSLARERQVIELLYGLAGEEPLSEARIAERLLMSKSHVGNIKRRALDRLRASAQEGVLDSKG